MRRAQANTWKAIETLSALIKPGMHETEAVALGKQVLADLDITAHLAPVVGTLWCQHPENLQTALMAAWCWVKTIFSLSTWERSGKGTKVMPVKPS